MPSPGECVGPVCTGIESRVSLSGREWLMSDIPCLMSVMLTEDGKWPAYHCEDLVLSHVRSGDNAGCSAIVELAVDSGNG